MADQPHGAPGPASAPQLVIFDCDGVLVDTERVANTLLSEALAGLGVELDFVETVARFKGRSGRDSLAIVERDFGVQMPFDLLERCRQGIIERFEAEPRTMPGIPEALAAIDLPTCVASSGEHDKMRRTLGATGLFEHFEGRIFSAADVERGKPFPDLFLHAAETLGAHPEHCVVVEDSVPGVEAGIAAGMRVLGYVDPDAGRGALGRRCALLRRHALPARAPRRHPVDGPMSDGYGTIELPSVSPGTARRVPVHRFGTPGARPKVYLQGALHADEVPGMLVLSHLVAQLGDAAAADAVRGEVVVVPAANPIGLAQWLAHHHVGRYELGGGGNFNRGWPDLADAVVERAGARIGADEAANVAALRAAALDANAALGGAGELDVLRRELLALSLDADVVLDLHCDNEALLHVYVGDDLWPAAQALCADLGVRAVLLAVESGGNPFDEVFSKLWHDLRERLGERGPIPPACLSATVELRGKADVGEAFAHADASALMRHLRRLGAVEGDPGPLPEALCAATALDATEVVRAPATGILSYRVACGDRVVAGDALADLVDPTAPDPLGARTVLAAGTDGLVLSMRADKLVRPGDSVAKIVGTRTVRGGRLSED